MKQKYLLFLALLISIGSFGQTTLHIDSIYQFIKRVNVHSGNADWSEIDKGFAKRLGLAKTEVDSVRAFKYVFEQLHDFHSSISYNGSYFSNNPDFSDSALKYLMPLVKLSNERANHFIAQRIQKKYLYLQIPGVGAMGNDVSVYAQNLSDTLFRYFTPKIKGIVLDLRLNGGGQFSSMAAGVAQLLGDGIVCGGVNNGGVLTNSFSIKDGNVFLNNTQMTFIRHHLKGDLSKMPIAVIIGPNTRSSGSILAIAFKSRPNTVFIGENTADGYTTGNENFSFSGKLFLNLSTSYSTDRNSNVFRDSVPPDIILKGPDDFNYIEKDQKIKFAVNWLKSGKY